VGGEVTADEAAKSAAQSKSKAARRQTKERLPAKTHDEHLGNRESHTKPTYPSAPSIKVEKEKRESQRLDLNQELPHTHTILVCAPLGSCHTN